MSRPSPVTAVFPLRESECVSEGEAQRRLLSCMPTLTVKTTLE